MIVDFSISVYANLKTMLLEHSGLQLHLSDDLELPLTVIPFEFGNALCLKDLLCQTLI